MIKTYIRQKWKCDLCHDTVLLPLESFTSDADEVISKPKCWLSIDSFEADDNIPPHTIELCPTCLLRIERRIAYDNNIQKLIDSTKDIICLSPDVVKTRMDRLSMKGKFEDDEMDGVVHDILEE